MQKYKRFIPLAIILFCIAALYFFGIHHLLSLETVKKTHAELAALVENHFAFSSLIFIGVYVVSSILLLPGIMVLSLLGGFLFPQPLSTFYVIFAATFGATIIFLATRKALSDVLQKKANSFVQKIENGFQENKICYLLFLRFAPLFPFPIVNITAAFFRVPTWTFVWTTFVGIIPKMIVATLAGDELGKIFANNVSFSLQTIFSTETKIIFGLLGCLALAPILIKKMRKSRL